MEPSEFKLGHLPCPLKYSSAWRPHKSKHHWIGTRREAPEESRPSVGLKDVWGLGR